MRLICFRRKGKGWLNSRNGFSRRAFCLLCFYIFVYPSFFLLKLLLVVAKYTQRNIYCLRRVGVCSVVIKYIHTVA